MSESSHQPKGRILGATYPMEPDPEGDADLNQHYDIEPDWLHFKKVKFKEASKRKRKNLCSLLVDKLDDILKEELKVCWLMRRLIRWFFLGPNLKKQFQL